MRKINLFSISMVFAVFLSGINLYSNEPFAPVFSIADGIENESEWRDRQEMVNTNLPTKSEVGLPAYPGAVTYNVNTATELENSDLAISSDAPRLARITILVTDPLEDVAEFYANNLPDNWEQPEMLMDVFFDSNYMGGPSKMIVQGPEIRISELSEENIMFETPEQSRQRKILQDGGCAITIFYKVE